VPLAPVGIKQFLKHLCDETAKTTLWWRMPSILTLAALLPPRARIKMVTFATTGRRYRSQNLAREYRSSGAPPPRAFLLDR